MKFKGHVIWQKAQDTLFKFRYQVKSIFGNKPKDRSDLEEEFFQKA
jgi:hypothetical protein